jgi:hypothetical protein
MCHSCAPPCLITKRGLDHDQTPGNANRPGSHTGKTRTQINQLWQQGDPDADPLEGVQNGGSARAYKVLGRSHFVRPGSPTCRFRSPNRRGLSTGRIRLSARTEQPILRGTATICRPAGGQTDTSSYAIPRTPVRRFLPAPDLRSVRRPADSPGMAGPGGRGRLAFTGLDQGQGLEVSPGAGTL